MADKDTFIKDDDKKVNPDNLSDVSGGIKFSVAGGNVGGNVGGDADEIVAPINKKLDLENMSGVAGGDSKWYFEASANRDILGEKPKHRKIDS